MVVKDGQYRFIDLEEVSEHKCHFRGDFIPDVNRPPWFTFGCKILFQLAVKMEIWNDSEFIISEFSYNFSSRISVARNRYLCVLLSK